MPIDRMNTIKHQSNHKTIAEVESNEVIISNAQDGLDLLGNLYYQGFDKIIIHKKNLTPQFFDLKNGLAGEILQKFSNYRIPLAIVGDFTPYTGESIRAFISECNRNGHISFVSSLEEALG